MRNLALESGHLAVSELEEDGRTSIILVPSGWSCAMYDLGNPPEGIWIRFDSREPALMGLSVDNLVTVCDDEINPKALALAKESLRASKAPAWIKISREENTVIITGKEIWS